ncbi:MerR family transcriptional regulator [Nannocystis radixulma]|uniref:HTH merR-type domain-containing protein n=1 Tax=Nannocystis radixulma TaxID=2995305 RepID=A0ABT5BQT9_9BACT|nr:MerR family transcriptional regulator [Nannocystis radixulma]MDC0676083.1 hypothetical protein [Nannocystis radixulma]
MPRTKPLPKIATTDDLVRITGLTSVTMYDWADKGLLPAPEVVSDGSRGIKARWPFEALERARFVMQKRAEMHTLPEIAAMIAEKWGPPTEEDKARRADTRAKRGRKKKQEPET